MKNKVSVIILNWNGWVDTIECLESLYKIDYPNYEVIVVDNGSTNESVEKIKMWADGKEGVQSDFVKYDCKNKPIKYFEYTESDLTTKRYVINKNKFDKLPSNKKLFILKNNKNYGFSEGNNVAARQVVKEKSSRYLLLLNNDTVVDKCFLAELVNTMIRNDKCGLVGSKIKCYYSPDYLDSAGSFFTNIGTCKSNGHGEKDVGQYDYIKNVSMITACCALVSIDLINKIGGLFDPRFFMYYEEMDLNIRVKNVNYKTIYNYKSVIYHKVSSSVKTINGNYYINKQIMAEKGRAFIIGKYFSNSLMIKNIHLLLGSYLWTNYALIRFNKIKELLMINKTFISSFREGLRQKDYRIKWINWIQYYNLKNYLLLSVKTLGKLRTR